MPARDHRGFSIVYGSEHLLRSKLYRLCLPPGGSNNFANVKESAKDIGAMAMRRSDAKVRGIGPKTRGRGRPVEMNGRETRHSRLFLRVRRVSNAQLQTPTIGSWSRLAKSTEIDATEPAAFPNVLFPGFLRRSRS